MGTITGLLQLEEGFKAMGQQKRRKNNQGLDSSQSLYSRGQETQSKKTNIFHKAEEEMIPHNYHLPAVHNFSRCYFAHQCTFLLIC